MKILGIPEEYFIQDIKVLANIIYLYLPYCGLDFLNFVLVNSSKFVQVYYEDNGIQQV